MNKFRGKALATILAAALVASSLPVTFASAKSTKHATGVLTKDPDNDEFWLVNGGSSKDDRSVKSFQNDIYTGTAPLETADHQDVDDPEVYSVSHVSGDKLVSWDIGDDKDDDNDKGDVKLSLRKSDSKGTEVIAVLYKGTYTDDNDNDVDVTASTKITIHAVDENSTVIGDASTGKVDNDGYYVEEDGTGCDSPELNGDTDDDDNFALKTTNKTPDSKQIAVYRAERANYTTKDGTVSGTTWSSVGKNDSTGGCLAVWKAMPTIAENDIPDTQSESSFLKNNTTYAYVLENTSKAIKLANETPTEAGAEATDQTDYASAPTAKLKDATKANSDVVLHNPRSSAVYYTVTDVSNPATFAAGAADVTINYDADAATSNAKIKDGESITFYADSAKKQEIVTYTYTAGAVVVSKVTEVSPISSSETDYSDKGIKVDVDTPAKANNNVTITKGDCTKPLYYSVGSAADASKSTEITDPVTVHWNAAPTDNTQIKDGQHIYLYKAQTGDPIAEYAYSAAGDTTTAASVKAAYPIVAAVPVNSAYESPVTLTNNYGSTVYYAVDNSDATKATELLTGSNVSLTASGDDAKLKDGSKIYVFASKAQDAKPMAQFSYDAGDSGSTQNTFVTATVNGDSTANLSLKGKLVKTFTTAVKKDDDIKAKVKVEKKVLVNDTATTDYTICKVERKTMLEGTGFDNVDINGGYIVKFVDRTNATATFKDDASVDSIKGKIKEVKVNDAKKVGNIDLKDGGVSIEDSDVKVDDITVKANDVITDPTISIDADNNVGTITVKDDDNGNSTVNMTAGTAKSIDTKGTVKLTGGEDDKPITVGSLSARDITLDSTDGAVTATKIVSNAPDSNENGCAIELDGDQTTVKSIDFAGFGTDLKTDDFQGTIPAPLNAKAEDATLETSNEDDDITVTGDLDIDTVDIDEDDSQITFGGKLSVNELEGGGTMYIGANKLYVGDDASGVKVRLTDAAIKAGDTICTAKSDAMNENDLDFYGFTVKKDAGKTVDTFKVDQLKFAGLAMNKTSDKIVLNNTTTYTASAYAPGTSIPEGYSIEFDMDDNSGVFELKDNGNGTAAVKCVDYDDTFAEENKATLKAYVVDASGDEDDDYGAAECKLTALKTPEKNFVSDTNNNFSVAPGASYQFKITADAAPVMTAGTAGVVKVANVGMSGKDYFIKITATGAVGAKTGIYVNGTKLLVVTVGTTQTFKSDTTVNVTVKKGSSYQYGITTSDGKAPFFTVGNGKAFNVKANGHNGSTYLYKITAVGSVGTQAGIYVNGTKVNVAKIG